MTGATDRTEDQRTLLLLLIACEMDQAVAADSSHPASAGDLQRWSAAIRDVAAPADRALPDPIPLWPTSCTACSTQLRPMHTFGPPSRLIWVERTEEATPLPVALETWTRHTPQRCQTARGAATT